MASAVLAAEQLERMSPAERHALFEASIVTDLEDAPREFVEWVRARVECIIADSESTNRG